jgi:5-methyltetrahydropteroyltriglutamate--homocysteine methyltransferase
MKAMFGRPWPPRPSHQSVEGVKNARVVVHVCWGNWGGTPAYYPDETGKPGEMA